MDKAITQFHLAIPVKDLEESRRFYRDVLGAREGRSTLNFIDFNFYGHHLVLHQAPREALHLFDTFRSAFHGETVQIPHFGMNLDWSAWSELAARIKSQDYPFFDPPHIRMQGKPGEHATLFVVDPSGNALEFKAFRNHDEVFAKVFDPATRDVFGLEELAADAASALN
jgi:extradiol dioxygenase family protein